MRWWRSVYRTGMLFGLLAMARVDGWWRTVFFGMKPGAAGAVWVHGWCRRIVGALGLGLMVEGMAPEDGAVVSNHLSYLDILMYAAVRPFVMVAKSEVRDWPLLGWITAQAGTVYIERADVKGGRTQTHAEVNALMAEAFQSGLPVMFFPEGTTTDGAGLLPFRRGLFHSVLHDRVAVRVAAVEYALREENEGASVAEDVCYWGEMEFVPHLFGCLGLRGVTIHLGFGADAVVGLDRFALAVGSRTMVGELRDGLRMRGEASVIEREVEGSVGAQSSRGVAETADPGSSPMHPVGQT